MRGEGEVALPAEGVPAGARVPSAVEKVFPSAENSVAPEVNQGSPSTSMRYPVPAIATESAPEVRLPLPLAASDQPAAATVVATVKTACQTIAACKINR